jgi:mono/diheme cytochrome c family protein
MSRGICSAWPCRIQLPSRGDPPAAFGAVGQVVCLGAFILTACAPPGPGAPPTPTPRPSAGDSPSLALASPSPSPIAVAGAPGTADQLAEAGRAVYAEQCAACHGTQGEGAVGPAVIGPRANLAKYRTARGLLDYTSSLMPQNAPGSLSPEAYLQVTAYLLVQNNEVQPSAPLDSSNLDGIQLGR